jgi:2-polyprenyl-3-methyl-5-hydroxy-6-metoxy-1,4-benzoquinol methylase
VKPDEVRTYFEQNAESWLLDAYEQSGFNYPTPFHRLRILRSLIRGLVDVRRVVDVGCGGGQVAIGLAEEGLEVLGVDESATMLEHARARLALAAPAVQARVSFERMPLEQLRADGPDAVVAMGVVGYLREDDVLFSAARRVIRPGGYLIASFRNRLFNLFPGSVEIEAEAASGHLGVLASEAATCYGTLDDETVLAFIRQLHAVTGQLLADPSLRQLSERSPSEMEGRTYSSDIRPRQTSPNEARAIAARNGFETIDVRGVHPHLISARMNQLLPPQVYNRLCDALTPLESSPVSLVWSSVFVAVFQRS